ncbi:hypothetical protein METH_09120 [Leisingera methylohalidivorans DSM 14336]|uniref:Uncharacterized protein n=1 Tax=Leisingera methylohalidivorans DSM 14336 TaxID=999552 RepID=V9W1I0_9RHOB|nr:hypothetical protein METH_09120 [Leisingera methylohalidivorans DSM 14336]
MVIQLQRLTQQILGICVLPFQNKIPCPGVKHQGLLWRCSRLLANHSVPQAQGKARTRVAGQNRRRDIPPF